MGSIHSQLAQGISGKAAHTFGNVFVPSNETVTAQISGDILQATVTSGWERKDLFIRIQNIDSIEISEAPIYALLSLGGSIILSGLGAFSSDAFLGLLLLSVGLTIAIWAIKKKRRLLVIHSLRSVMPIYMDKAPEEYQLFAKQLMTLARRLNTPPHPVQRPEQPQAQNNGQRRQRAAGTARQN